MSVLSYAGVLSSLVPGDPIVEEQDVVRSHDLVVELPLVVGLRVGLGCAQDLATRGPLFDGDELVRDLDVLRWVLRRTKRC